MAGAIPVIGSIVGGLLSNKGSSTTSVQKADPWSGVQPALTNLYDAALQNFQGPGQQYYPGLTVAPQSDVTQQAQRDIYGRATSQSPLMGAAEQQSYNTLSGDYFGANPAAQDMYNFAGDDFMQGNPVMDTLNDIGQGQMLNANPHVDSMFNQAAGRVGEQFSKNVMPGIASMFSGAGRFGSNQMAEGLNQAQDNYSDTINNLATSIYGGNYAAERGMQNQALGQLGQFGLAGRGLQQQAASDLGTMYGRERAMQAGAVSTAPMLEQAGYYGADRLAGLGASQDLYNQSILDADMARYGFGQQRPEEELAFLSQLLQGTGQYATQSATSKQPGNWMQGALGGALMGNSLSNGSMFGGSESWRTTGNGMPPGFDLNLFG